MNTTSEGFPPARNSSSPAPKRLFSCRTLSCPPHLLVQHKTVMPIFKTLHVLFHSTKLTLNACILTKVDIECMYAVYVHTYTDFILCASIQILCAQVYRFQLRWMKIHYYYDYFQFSSATHPTPDYGFLAHCLCPTRWNPFAKVIFRRSKSARFRWTIVQAHCRRTRRLII